LHGEDTEYTAAGSEKNPVKEVVEPIKNKNDYHAKIN
jgi:hypothetical protein